MKLLTTHWRSILLTLFLVPFTAFVIFIAWSYYMWGDEMTDMAWRDNIRTQIRLEPEHVDGAHLPSTPSPEEVDTTVAGVDRNKNTIRDDVELKIFELYPGTQFIKERAVALQYAQSEQILFTWVVGKLSMEAYLEKSGRAFWCVSDFYVPPGSAAGLTDEEFNKLSSLSMDKESSFRKPLDELMLNTQQRRTYQKNIFSKYMTGNTSLKGDDCDLTFNFKHE